MEPRVTVLVPTVDMHRKWWYLYDLMLTCTRQTLLNWEMILMVDRPEDHDFLCRKYLDNRIRVVFDDNMDRGTQHPIPYLLNRYYPESRGDLIIAAFDDDLFHPTTFETCCKAFDANPGQMAGLFSLQHQTIHEPGITDEARGHWFTVNREMHKGELDCRFDGGQACIRKELLDIVPAPWWREAPDGEMHHVDGIYLEHLAEHTSFMPIGQPDVPYLTHRFTPVSSFHGS